MGAIKNIFKKIDPLVKPFHSYGTTIFPYYHTVSNENLPHIKGLYNYKNEKEFIKDLDFLLKKYKILEPSELIKSIQSGSKTPANSFLLSFDDGLSEVYETIVPILNQKGIPAIFFINSRYVDNKELFYKHKISILVQHFLTKNENDESIEKAFKIIGLKPDINFKLIQNIKSIGHTEDQKLDELLSILNIDQSAYLEAQKPYLTFSQLNEIKNQGHYLGGHTVNHYPLDQLSLTDQVDEILDSIIWLKNNFKLDYELFSFPFSSRSASRALFEKLFSAMPNLICMGNQGITKDISNKIVQRFSLEKEKQADIGIRTNIAYGKYLTITGKAKSRR